MDTAPKIEEQTTAEERLNHYLECEDLLKQFFEQVDYCSQNCVNLPEGKYFVQCFHPKGGLYIRGDVGCCLTDVFEQHSKEVPDEHFALLNKRRIEKYGKPVNQEEKVLWFGKPCSYHTKEEGCTIEDHRGPFCLTYICESLDKYLKNSLGIKFDMRRTLIALEDTLSGEITAEDLEAFKEKVRELILKTR